MKLDRRNMLLLGGGAAAVAVAAGVVLWPSGKGPDQAGKPPVDPKMASLLVPGPLGDQELGSKDAAVTMIEYASMTCPHCARFHNEVYPDLKRKYIDTGKIRFIFREYPLDQRAHAASMLARCAEENKFFPFLDILFQKQQQWAPPDDWDAQLLKLSQFAGFSKESFIKCLRNVEIAEGVIAVRNRAEKEFQVNSTPSFFINDTLYRGNMSFEEIEKIIDPLLAG